MAGKPDPKKVDPKAAAAKGAAENAEAADVEQVLFNIMPGDWAGRFAPSFEFVFHFNRQSRKPNKIVPCKHAGQESHLRADGSSTAMRNKAGEVVAFMKKADSQQHIAEHGGSALPLSEALAMLP